MADKRSNNHANFPEKQTWGTREELLLAFAVHRYGTDNWSSVALEVQKRSSGLQLLITPLSCQQKYHDLRRRFSQNDAVNLTDDNNAVSWLEELKKLRVAELKRELERYDISIVSLQLKVKRLIEEREQSSKKNEEDEPEKSNQTRTVERTGENKKEIIINYEPESVTAKPDIDQESDRENRSVNESNSTDPNAEEDEKEPEPEPNETFSDKPEHLNDDVRPAGEESCKGSCGRVDSGNLERVVSTELGESVAESKDDDNEERESSSDVQSAVSLSRKKEEKSEEPDEPENEGNQSPAPIPKRGVSVESQPLVDCLEIIQSHKFGSLFECLYVKETPNYRTLIRQHIDLETIRTRLEENWYSGCHNNFFRDLLLLFNNALVFFGKNTSESATAIELRQIVLKEMAQRLSNSNSSLKEESAQNVKIELEPSGSLLSEKNILIPLIACRKRSSITAKRAVSASSGAERKEETTALIDKNSAPDAKDQNKSYVKTDQENDVTKKRMRERSASSTRRSSREKGKSPKSRVTTKTKKSSAANANAADHSNETSSDNSEIEAEKERENKANVNAKKRSAANFLSRMKRSSPSKIDSLVETLKSSVISSENGGERGEQNSKNGKIVKVDKKREQIKQTRSGGKRGKERESLAKRNEGRPTRRASAAPAQVVVATRGKRRRNIVETEVSSLGRAKKRSKK